MKYKTRPTSASFQVFSYVTEDIEKVKLALFNILPKELHEKIKLNISKTEGYFKDPIHIISTKLRGKEVDSFLRYVAERLPKRTKIVMNKTIAEQIDEHGNLYLRFSKDDVFDNKIAFGDRDVIWCKIHFSAKGDKKKSILEYLKEIKFIVEDQK